MFIDTEYDTWNMDPVALEKAFELYPEVRVVVMAIYTGRRERSMSCGLSANAMGP